MGAESERQLIWRRLEEEARGADGGEAGPLATFTVYGSLVRGVHQPGTSDVNLLLAAREFSPRLREAVSLLLGRLADLRPDPLLLTVRELEPALASFPTRFLEVRRGYRVLAGEDLLAAWEPDRPAVAHRCRQEHLNLLLRHRRRLAAARAEEDHRAAVRSSLAPLLKLLRHLLFLRTGVLVEERERLAREAASRFRLPGEDLLFLVQVRRGAIPLRGEEWRETSLLIGNILELLPVDGGG
jgi:hypothetical protein